MVNDSKISVAMTTYNGERFIIEQLESLLRQTKAPDEVIIVDDCSTDKTASKVNKFISDCGLKNWSIVVNDEQLGWKKNFRKSISLSTGDYIFFSDQDDIWNDDKIEVMSKLMSERKMDALYAENTKIDADGNPLLKRNERKTYTMAVERVTLSQGFYAIKTLGCCMCINRKVADKYLELNCIDSDHDSQCGRIAALYGTLWHYDAPVIKYRIHGANTSGISNEFSYGSSTLKKRVEEIKTNLLWLEKVQSDEKLDLTRKKLIIDALCLQKKRLDYLTNSKGSIFSLVKGLKEYPSISMLVGDYAYKNGFNRTWGKFRWWLRRFVRM